MAIGLSDIQSKCGLLLKTAYLLLPLIQPLAESGADAAGIVQQLPGLIAPEGTRKYLLAEVDLSSEFGQDYLALIVDTALFAIKNCAQMASHLDYRIWYVGRTDDWVVDQIVGWFRVVEFEDADGIQVVTRAQPINANTDYIRRLGVNGLDTGSSPHAPVFRWNGNESRIHCPVSVAPAAHPAIRQFLSDRLDHLTSLTLLPKAPWMVVV